jgi:hypothetical protein
MATQTKTRKSQIDSLVADVKGKAQNAYAKGSAVAGELGNMTKGNVAAVVSSGRILGAGIKELGEGSLVESRQVIDTLASDLKAFAAVKSPAEFLQLQFKLAQRNVDAAFALGTKNANTIGKLASEAAAPISGQVKANVAKIRAVV